MATGILGSLNPGMLDNPIYKGFSNNRNAISSLLLNSIGGTPMEQMRNAGIGLQRGQQVDTTYAMEQEKQQKAQDDLNRTIQYLQTTRPDLASAVQAGMPIGEAWKTAMQPQSPDAPKVQKRYNPKSGQEEYVQWNAQSSSWEPFGGAKAATDGISLQTTADGGISFNMGGTAQSGRSIKKMGEGLSAADAKMIEAEREQARAADDLSATVDQLEMVIGNVGYTGPGGEAYGKLDDLVGVLPGEAGPRGAARSLGMEAQLAMTQKTKGAITDREMGMFKAAVPGLQQTPEGNQQIIAAMRATANRQKLRAQFMERYLETNGSMQNAQAAWNGYINDNPLIERNPDGSLRVMESADPTPYLTAGRGSAGGTIPDGVDPGVWEFMTPEERALWQ